MRRGLTQERETYLGKCGHTWCVGREPERDVGGEGGELKKKHRHMLRLGWVGSKPNASLWYCFRLHVQQST